MAKKIMRWSRFLELSSKKKSYIWPVGTQVLYDNGKLPQGLTSDHVHTNDILDLQRDGGLPSSLAPGKAADWLITYCSQPTNEDPSTLEGRVNDLEVSSVVKVDVGGSREDSFLEFDQMDLSQNNEKFLTIKSADNPGVTIGEFETSNGNKVVFRAPAPSIENLDVSVEQSSDTSDPDNEKIPTTAKMEEVVNVAVGNGRGVYNRVEKLSHTTVLSWFTSSNSWIDNGGNNYCAKIEVGDASVVRISRTSNPDRTLNANFFFSSEDVTLYNPTNNVDLTQDVVDDLSLVKSHIYYKKALMYGETLDIPIPDGARYFILELKNGSSSAAKTYDVYGIFNVMVNRINTVEQELNQTRSQSKTYPKIYQGEYIDKNLIRDDSKSVTIGAIFNDFAVKLYDSYKIIAIKEIFPNGEICNPNKVYTQNSRIPRPNGVIDTDYGGGDDYADRPPITNNYFGVCYTNPNIGYVLIVAKSDNSDIDKDELIIKDFDFLDGYNSVGYNRYVDIATSRTDEQKSEDEEYFKACIKRAKKMLCGRWSPMKKINYYQDSWNERVFNAGHTYTGFPYSRIMERNRALGYAVQLRTFYTAIKNPRSMLYTECCSPVTSGSTTVVNVRSEYGYSWIGSHGCPYYGLVCSNFVGYVLGLSHIYTTSELGLYNVDQKSLDGGTLKKRNGVSNTNAEPFTLAEMLREDIDFVNVTKNIQPLDIIVCTAHTFMCLDVLNDADGNRKYVVIAESISPTFKVEVYSLDRLYKRLSRSHHQIIHYTPSSGWPEKARYKEEDAELIPMYEQVDSDQYPNMTYPYNPNICPYKGDYSIYWSDSATAEPFYINCRKGDYSHIVFEKLVGSDWVEQEEMATEIVNDSSNRVRVGASAATPRVVTDSGVDAGWYDVNMTNKIVGKNGKFRAKLTDAATESAATINSDWCYFEVVDAGFTHEGNTITFSNVYGTPEFAGKRLNAGEGVAWDKCTEGGVNLTTVTGATRIYLMIRGEYGQATRVLDTNFEDVLL